MEKYLFFRNRKETKKKKIKMRKNSSNLKSIFFKNLNTHLVSFTNKRTKKRTNKQIKKKQT